MKNELMNQLTLRKAALILMCALVFMSCESDDDATDDGFQGESKEYELEPVSGSSIEGPVTFTENEDGSTTVEIELDGTEEGETYTVGIYEGNTTEAGELALTLEEIEGDNGTSTTTVSELDDETEVTYEDLMELDAHINIYLVEGDTETLVAQADLGENELSGESVSYDLDAVGDEGTAGSVTLEERLNGETLITITLEETEEGSEHPSFIHSGAIGDEQGDAVISLNPVQDGVSKTNISAFNGEGDEDGESVTYEELIEYDGSLNVYLSEEEMETMISHGNIGSNATEE